MKFNLTLLTCLLCLTIGFALTSIIEAQDGEKETPTGSGPADSTPAQRGFFSSLISPLKNSLRRARDLFKTGTSNLNDRMDNLRMKTFQAFMRIYNKTYSADEIPKRMKLFFQRRQLIEESVKMFERGQSTFVMRENLFTDWDDDEIKKLAGVSLPEAQELEMEIKSDEYKTSNEEKLIDGANVEPIVGNSIDETGLRVRAQIPAQKDWRESGCVAAPLNQMKCGACYAVASIGVVEAMRCLKQDSAPTLSPQQVVDCSTPRTGYANYGCDGGWPTRVLKYLQDVQVISRDTCYPFVRRQNTCKIRTVQSTGGCTVNASPTDQSRLQYKVLTNERDMLYHVANTGPIIGVLQASDKFLYYGKGVFDDSRCTRRRDDVDHAIQLVGYGRENGVDYWLIKNSWGTTTWGEDGYGKVKRGTNACSIGYFGWAVTA